jgi:site-specific recombinase XerD
MYTHSVKKEEIPRCIQVFEQSVDSEVTRKNYRQRLDAFMEFAKITSYDNLIKTSPKQLQLYLENYVMSLKRRHEKGDFRARSFNAYLSAIEAFFIQNDIVLNFKKVKRWIPKYEKLTGEEPYTTEDIKKMLSIANIRWKAVIHFFASTGARPEGVFELKKKHLRSIENGCIIVTIYENENEEYYGFLTPEATAALNAYFEKRQFDGEKLTDESPVFRNVFRETQGWKNIKHIKMGTAYSSFAQILSRAGIRKIKKGDNKTRHSKRIFYGLI